MRIVVVEDWFSEKMGYAENCLSKALAALGQDVHVVTSTAQVYFSAPFYKEVYEPYLGPSVVEPGVKHVDGYTLHRLPYGSWRGRLRIQGLLAELAALRPNVVQTFDAIAISTRESAAGRLWLGYRLFTGCHDVISVFPPAQPGHALDRWGQARWTARVRLPGRAVSLVTERCYAVTPDAASIAVDFYGVQAGKVQISPLGVDTALFRPVDCDAMDKRRELRQRLGVGDSDVLCIYTGRFTPAKNPACLAEAVATLVSQGLPFRALFVGDGPQEAQLRATPGCLVTPFVPYPELPAWYRAADIGVWPMEESTSMLDAAASGLPVVTNGSLRALEHLGGDWVPYRGGDVADMVRALVSLVDGNRRQALGRGAAATIDRDHSWLAIARARLADYDRALSGGLR